MVAECHGRVLCLRAFASCLGGSAAAGGSVTCTTGLIMRSSDAPNTPRPSMFVGGVIALVADTTFATVLRNLHVHAPELVAALLGTAAYCALWSLDSRGHRRAGRPRARPSLRGAPSQRR